MPAKKFGWHEVHLWEVYSGASYDVCHVMKPVHTAHRILSTDTSFQVMARGSALCCWCSWQSAVPWCMIHVQLSSRSC